VITDGSCHMYRINKLGVRAYMVWIMYIAPRALVSIYAGVGGKRGVGFSYRSYNPSTSMGIYLYITIGN
jgi:hypothetical protein